MTFTQTVTTRAGFGLMATIARQESELDIRLQASKALPVRLHWGLRRRGVEGWLLPPPASWPPGSLAAGPTAVQTPFPTPPDQAGLRIRLNPSDAYTALEFVLFFPKDGRWDNNAGRNYQVALEEPAGAACRARLGSEEVLLERVFELGGGAELAAGVTRVGDEYRVRLLSNWPNPLVLHWGLAQRSPREWLAPGAGCRGDSTTLLPGGAAETPFVREASLSSLEFRFAAAEVPLGMPFVLREEPPGRWIKDRGGNFYLPVRARALSAGGTGPGAHVDLAEEIIRAETHQSWTLMHRFNLCHDLLERVKGSPDGVAWVYVYLRFSAIRQLTWQRNYNTKPRELAHAQDRLTQKLASLYGQVPGCRGLARLIFTTVGRGGDGQRIRDEILHIMHRHHIKEVSGHFLEEWHQKLHNNTTPDDLVICEAYLAFLRDNGNRDSFYRTLEAGGVSRQRLQSFERPIRSDPDFVPHLKDGLLHDFGQFLRILRASHSGTDLETALQAARGQLDGGLQGLLSYLWERRNVQGDEVLDLVRQTTEARRRLAALLGQSGGLRELLYLDLALEQMIRAAIERSIHLRFPGGQLVDLIGWILENLTISHDQPELSTCWRHWERLRRLPGFGADWSLHAKSVADRMSRALSDWIDHVYQLLQPKAELLGQGIQAESWTINLFSEEVVRGNSLGFVLSALLRHLEPILREAAHLGNWQIISRGRGAGEVEVVDSLRSIQGKRFETPKVIVASQVTGEEEIPEGVTAVIAPDVVDIVSHVAVRARNAGVLFASCHAAEVLQHLKSLHGRYVQLNVTVAGDVVAEETAPTAAAPVSTAPAPARPAVLPPSYVKGALALAEFDPKRVGGKAWRQAELRAKLPGWIRLPASAAVPFGVMEHVLSLKENEDVARRCHELGRQLVGANPETLSALRQSVLGLAAPEELRSALRQAMTAAGLPWPEDWEGAWNRIKQVWASKWNERAVLSRQRFGLPPEALFMSVLIQEVVPADYAFVIHTVNPSTGRRDELFGEIVLGLGETLVGNYPGRALSFVCHKTSGAQTLLSYPSKSIGLSGRGLIFRSDSNGEDLAGYAGAGLYDSVLLEPPRAVPLDYTDQPLCWEEGFRRELIATITRLGLEVERLCGSPQDIEGAVVGGQFYLVQTRPQVGVD